MGSGNRRARATHDAETGSGGEEDSLHSGFLAGFFKKSTAWF
jgi:hypothetical protein